MSVTCQRVAHHLPLPSTLELCTMRLHAEHVETVKQAASWPRALARASKLLRLLRARDEERVCAVCCVRITRLARCKRG
jgi:hypothetical protein